MAHVYDHGGPSPLRKMLREAIAARLAPLKVAEGKYVKQVCEWPAPGRMDDDSLEFMISHYTQGVFPTVAVAIGDRNYESRSADGLSLSGILAVFVYVLCKHQRSTLSRQSGDVASAASDTADPGAETILEHVFELLANQAMGVDGCGKLTPVDETIEAFGDEALIWQLAFNCKTEIRINPDRAASYYLDSVMMHHTIPDSEPGPQVSQLIEDDE